VFKKFPVSIELPDRAFSAPWLLTARH